MPPSNWIYTIMAVSLFFNLAGFLSNQRLALIDLNRVALENDIASLFGDRVSIAVLAPVPLCPAPFSPKPGAGPPLHQSCRALRVAERITSNFTRG